MGWQSEAQLRQAKENGIERSLFPNLSGEEQAIVDMLNKTGDLQLSQLSVKTNLPMSQLNALLFQLEMKGVVRPLAGGTYHLLI
jgi:DNA processing protein